MDRWLVCPPKYKSVFKKTAPHQILIFPLLRFVRKFTRNLVGSR